MIQKVKDSLTSGTKLFNRHNEDNSTVGRKSVGEVLTSYTKEIGGRLRTIAIAAMEKAESALYDVCSIEANIFEENGIVQGIETITGIAVSSSKVDKPAFRNAKRMQIVQMFESEGEPQTTGEEIKNMSITLNDLMTAPIDLFKQAISAREMFPSQLFPSEVMERDNNLKDIFADRIALRAENIELKKQVSDSAELVKNAERTTALSGAKDKLKAQMPEGMTDKQKSFITNRFDPEKMETLDENTVGEFIKSSQKEYQDMAKLFSGDGSSAEETNIDPEDKSTQDVSIDDAFSEE